MILSIAQGDGLVKMASAAGRPMVPVFRVDALQPGMDDRMRGNSLQGFQREQRNNFLLCEKLTRALWKSKRRKGILKLGFFLEQGHRRHSHDEEQQENPPQIQNGSD
jgi:hypothetical protein